MPRIYISHPSMQQERFEGFGGYTRLTRMSCNNNLLTDLDLSGNPGLVFMISRGNRLTELDISNNMQLVKIGFDNMPMLHEVCVWTFLFPPPGVEILMDYSPNVQFITGGLNP